jgi:hypothetical protein
MPYEKRRGEKRRGEKRRGEERRDFGLDVKLVIHFLICKLMTFKSPFRIKRWKVLTVFWILFPALI